MSLQRSAAGIGVARGLGLLGAVAFTLYTAYRFGSDRVTDIVFNALILPNTLMTVITMFLPPVLTSMFRSIEVGQGSEEAWAFGRSVPRVAAAVCLVVAVVGALASPLLARAVGAGFSPEEGMRLAGFMEVAFLIVFLTGISSAIKGILNANRVLFVPSLDTAFANVVGIGMVAALAGAWGGPALIAAAVGMSLAKLLLVIPQYATVRPSGPAPLHHPLIGRALASFAPVALNGLLIAVTATILRSYASRIPVSGAVSHMAYAERIYSAPPDLFVASLGVALLPAMAGHAAAGQLDRVRHLTTVGLRMSFFFGIPAAVGLAMLAEPVVALLCQHGRFDHTATAGTARALRGLAPALAFSGQLIVFQAFYALGRTRAILASGGMMLVGNSVLGALLVGPLGQYGLATAFAISYGMSFVISLVLFSRVAGGWPDLKALASGILRTATASGGMAGVVWETGRRWPQSPVLVRIAVGAGVFLFLSWFLCPEEWKQARKLRSKADT